MSEEKAIKAVPQGQGIQVLTSKFDADTDRMVAISSESPMPAAIKSPIDSISEAVIGIEFEHHELHEGDAYSAHAIDLTMANNEVLVLAFLTPPDTKRMHMIMGFITNGDGNIAIIEAPTWNAQTGTLAPIFNRFRGSPNMSDALENQAQPAFVASGNFILNPTGLAGGTIIDTTYTFAAKNAEQGGGRGVNEWVLRPSTQYAIRLTSNEAGNSGQISLDWYEHTDSNV